MKYEQGVIFLCLHGKRLSPFRRTFYHPVISSLPWRKSFAVSGISLENG
jgi:hypothetical protein